VKKRKKSSLRGQEVRDEEREINAEEGEKGCTREETADNDWRKESRKTEKL